MAQENDISYVSAEKALLSFFEGLRFEQEREEHGEASILRFSL